MNLASLAIAVAIAPALSGRPGDARAQSQAQSQSEALEQPIPPLPQSQSAEPPAAPRVVRHSRRVDADVVIPLGFPPDTLGVQLARMLDHAGIDRATLSPDPRAVALWGGGAGRTPLYDFLVSEPDRAPDLLRVFGAAAVGATAKPSELVLFAGQRAGFGVGRGLLESPHAGRWAATADPPALERELRAISERRFGEFERSGAGAATAEPKGKPSRKAARAKAEGDVPPDALHLAAFLLSAERAALGWRDAALSGPHDMSDLTSGVGGRDEAGGDPPAPEAAALDSAFALLLRAYASGDREEDAGDLRRAAAIIEPIDLALLHAGAMDIALALDEARAKADSLQLAGDYHVEAETPLGTVVIDGSHAARYDDPGPYLLIVDAGGHDTYAGGAATLSAASPVSILFEVAGDDVYAADAADSSAPSRPAFGGACLGYAMLIDLAGNDTYRGGSCALGAAVAGAGLLLDASGDDRYDAIAFAEGAARAGVGVLGDGGGRDRYRAFQAAQGYGGPRGAGLLADSSGNDTYLADDTEIRFPSAQSALHNTSLAQGAGCGTRADFSDGHSLAGGVGLLADGAGDDTYRCGVFGQGVGYWYGVGALYDAAGRDSFDGAWYVQGAAAHFAVGALLEMDGNDAFRATDNMAQGAGHDFSIGLFLDYGGDDQHDAPNLSLGGGNANGVGIFFDEEGRDVYRASAGGGSMTFGRGDTAGPRGVLRDLFPTVGVFLDGGGLDEYPAPPEAAASRAATWLGNARIWRQEGMKLPSLTTEVGVGDDR